MVLTGPRRSPDLAPHTPDSVIGGGVRLGVSERGTRKAECSESGP